MFVMSVIPYLVIPAPCRDDERGRGGERAGSSHPSASVRKPCGNGAGEGVKRDELLFVAVQGA
jgi:hypothetical protein